MKKEKIKDLTILEIFKMCLYSNCKNCFLKDKIYCDELDFIRNMDKVDLETEIEIN